MENDDRKEGKIFELSTGSDQVFGTEQELAATTILVKRRRKVIRIGRAVGDQEQEKIRRKKLEEKIKNCTKVVSGLAVTALVLEVINTLFFDGLQVALSIGLATCFFLGSAVFLYMLHENLSSAVLCKLAKEPNVIFIILLCTLNLIVECVVPHDDSSIFLATTYLLNGIYFILFDAMEQKSRNMSIAVGVLFVTITIYNALSVTFILGNSEVVFFEYGDNFKLYKVSLKRSIYFQVLSFSVQAIYCLLTDKKMNRLMFVTSNLYREEVVEEKTEAHDNSANAFNTNLQYFKDEGKSRPNISRNLKRWRVGSICFCGCCMLLFSFYIFYNIGIRQLWVVMGFSVAGVLAFTSYLVGILYKNVHLVVFKMLLREVNVVTIFLTTIVLLFVDFAKPNTSVSAVFSVLYVGCTWIFVSFDLLVKKDRKFVLFVGILYVLSTVYEFIDFTFLDAGKGVILVETSFGLKLYKRPVSRAIFAHLLGLSIGAVVTMFKDREEKRMMFLTDNVYRMTGETSMDFRKARLSYLDRRQSDKVRKAEKTMELQELGRRTSSSDVLV